MIQSFVDCFVVIYFVAFWLMIGGLDLIVEGWDVSLDFEWRFNICCILLVLWLFVCVCHVGKDVCIVGVLLLNLVFVLVGFRCCFDLMSLFLFIILLPAVYSF